MSKEENYLKNKQRSYRLTFENEAGKTVLADLRTFCHATKTTIVKDKNDKIDTDAMLRLEGRREVFLQIMNMLKIDFSDYYNYEED